MGNSAIMIPTLLSLISFCLEYINCTKFMILSVLAQWFMFNIIQFYDNQNFKQKCWKLNR